MRPTVGWWWDIRRGASMANAFTTGPFTTGEQQAAAPQAAAAPRDESSLYAKRDGGFADAGWWDGRMTGWQDGRMA